MDADLTVTLELVRAAQAGDDEAFDRLVGRYYERVRRIVRLRLGGKLRERLDSGDILQETFAQAVRLFDRFEMRDEGSLIHWLAKLAERQILAAADYHAAQMRDANREQAIAQGSSDGSGSDALGALGGSPATPTAEVVGDEENAAVEACMAALPEELRELILLRDYSGLEWADIAKETGRPSPDAARMMHARAVAELGKCLRARGVDG